jgi:uncharacterized protein (DUF2062 family)
MLTTTQIKSYFTSRYYIGIALVIGIAFSLLVDLAVIPVSMIANPIGSLIIMVASWVAGLFFLDLLAPLTGVTSDGHYSYKYIAISRLMTASKKVLQKALIVSLVIGVGSYLLQGYFFLSPLPQLTRFLLNSVFIGMLGIVITSVVVMFKSR